MSKFTSKKEISGKSLKMALGGIIDEDADFKDLSVAGFDAIDIDLNDLKSINSCGIREWIKWLSGNSSAEIKFNNCPKVIVDQINMVDGFLPKNASVKSFFVPYFNEELGSEKSVLYREGSEFIGNQINHPPSVKDGEGNDMEMDVIESKYFKFVTSRPAG
jgi:hypothetical protein